MGCKYVKEFEFGTPKAYAKGGKVVEKATGEVYPSRKAMEKHERMETPKVQREELIQKAEVRAPARRAVPVANAEPMIAMKRGGAAKRKC